MLSIPVSSRPSARAADATAHLERAYTDHGEALVRQLASFTRDRQVAEDLAHDAFVRLAREMNAGRTPENAGAWLHRVGRNLATSRARHERVVARRQAELPRPSQPASPESAAEDRELGGAVCRLIAELSVSERQVFVMAAHGATGIEIAATVGRTHAATRTLLCRVRAKLRDGLASGGLAQA